MVHAPTATACRRSRSPRDVEPRTGPVNRWRLPSLSAQCGETRCGVRKPVEHQHETPWRSIPLPAGTSIKGVTDRYPDSAPARCFRWPLCSIEMGSSGYRNFLRDPAGWKAFENPIENSQNIGYALRAAPPRQCAGCRDLNPGVRNFEHRAPSETSPGGQTPRANVVDALRAWQRGLPCARSRDADVNAGSLSPIDSRTHF